jgi:oxalate decarboxylase/phosphoglucose isomerase-like protein (cupin superfamily)
MLLPKLESVDTYARWQESESIPVITGFFIEDLNAVPLAPWRRKGGNGAFINLEGTGGTNDAYLCEIPSASALHPQRHIFEELVYVLRGKGATTVWYDGGPKRTFEWQEGSVFAIPLNAWHQHFNGQGNASTRYVAVTNAPLIMALFHNLTFIFDNPGTFEDRFAGQADYFNGKGTLYDTRQNVMETNFIADAKTMEIPQRPDRGAGGNYCQFEMAGGTMIPHISQFPVGTYKKAHRHGPGAHVIILGGEGFSLLWPEGRDKLRVEWKPGCMLVPPNQWYHQHFNTGNKPARYLALRWGSKRFQVVQMFFAKDEGYANAESTSVQIEYEDEDPKIHEMFEADLARSGASCRMRSLIASCRGI